MKDLKIPQAVAWVLLVGALTAAEAQTTRSAPAKTKATATAPAKDNDSATRAELTKLLREFLAEVPSGKPEVFDRFFADDILYTRSAGVTITKADIMKGIEPPKPGEPKVTYEAEDITIHPYGGMAIVNFRLVQHTEANGKVEMQHYRNTGTFLKRKGKWQAVAWQATKAQESAVAKDQQ